MEMTNYCDTRKNLGMTEILTLEEERPEGLI